MIDDEAMPPHPSDPSGLTDDDLVDRCRIELPYNHFTFEVLVRRYEPLVFATCRQYLVNPADAEEVAQDVFLRVFHGLARFRSDASFRTWLFRIVRNECVSRLRTLERTETRHAAYAQQREPAEPLSAQADFPPAGEWTGRVGEVLRQLSDQDRQVLVFRHLTGLSFDELAGALELKLSAAKMRLYRAEERFRTLYHPDQ
jgi:RNA polymerase sigma-70 factor (ECF subfamily)